MSREAKSDEGPMDYTVTSVNAEGKPFTRETYEAFAQQIRKSFEPENYQNYLKFSAQMNRGT